MDALEGAGEKHLRADTAHVRIEPSRGWIALKLGELWEYRELLYFLTLRDKQTALGAAWAIIQPFFTMLVFSLFFGKLAKVPSDGVPYPISAYVALLPWNYFAGSLGQSANSVVSSADLIKKVYFPRLVVPISGVLSGLLDFAIASMVLLVMMAYYGIRPTAATLLLPGFLLLALVASLGTGMWLSALNVEYREGRPV